MIEFQNKIENVGTERNGVVWLRNLWNEELGGEIGSVQDRVTRFDGLC